MADDEDGLVLVDLAQVVLQPLHGLEVEVVGGLVEQQVVGLAEEGFGEHHAHLLVVAELARQLLVQALGDTQVLQQLGSLALGLPAVHLGKLQLQVGSTVAVLLRHLGLGIEGLALLHVLPERGMAHEDRVEHAIGVILEMVLLQDREALARTQLHGTLVGLQVAGDGAKKGGLAGSVGANDAIDVAARELDVYVFVKYSLAKLDGKIVERYHIMF